MYEFEADSDEFPAKMEYASRFSVGDLISMCNVLGLVYNADKEGIRQKIVRSLTDITSLILEQNGSDTADDDVDYRQETENNEVNNIGNMNDDVEDAESRVDEVEAASQTNNLINSRNTRKVQFTLGFRDVEETIRDFNGNDDFPIERWVADFEDAARLFGWEDIQKIIKGTC